MNFISVKNSSKTASELMFNKNAFIHRKNKGDKVRFNPSFKEYIGEKGIGFTREGDKVFIAIGDYTWKLSKSSNMKVSTLTSLLDLVYHKNGSKTNRYKLSYVETNDYGDIFEVSPMEEVSEKQISEEMRQAAIDRLAVARARKNSSETPFENQVSVESNFQAV